MTEPLQDSALPDYRLTSDFRDLVRDYATKFANADAACRDAAEARRKLWAEAKEFGIAPGLLKTVVRESALSPDDLTVIEIYRRAINQNFEKTELGRAAQ